MKVRAAATLVFVAGLLPVHAETKSRHWQSLRSHACPIVAFGDSITWGAYASIGATPSGPEIKPLGAHLVGSHDTSYPGDLQRMIHRHVCNFGVPGEEARDGLDRLHDLLNIAGPHTVLLMEGVNDLASDRTIDQVTGDLLAMVLIARHAGAHVVLLTLTPTYYPAGSDHHFLNAKVLALNRQVRRLAKETHVPLADVEHAFRRDHRGARLTLHVDGYDYLHPNDAGYLLIAKTAAKVMKKHHLAR